MARNRKNRQAPVLRTQLRCAIYTRKSTEDGLEQEFNSLDAQREACAAYILSQRHEGWSLMPDAYDDGGFSGGSMDRPALRRLLAEVEAGRVDVIVVYKVDRLTRSLSDFARIVEVLDDAGASFVSVTQAFNTTSSMGRLTLNVLLSFAQFEREVTGERIRDKVAASKKKGMWMGGNVPLGYDVVDRKLVVNAEEAEKVRHIFSRYIALRSISALQEELARDNIGSKFRIARSGRAVGGGVFTYGALCHLIQNRTFLGLVHHQGEYFPGEHEAIVDTGLFEAAQALLEQNRVGRTIGTNINDPGLLSGLLHDALGRRMKATHSRKETRRYRYYASRKEDGAQDAQVWRVPAGEIEDVVLRQLRAWLDDTAVVHALVQSGITEGLSIHHLQRSIERRAATLLSGSPADRRRLLLTLVAHMELDRDCVRLTVRPACLLDEIVSEDPFGGATNHPETILSAPCELIRAGRGNRLVIAPSRSHDHASHDSSLIGLVVRAHMARTALEKDPGLPIAAAAQGLGHDIGYFRVLVRLSFLAPDIVAAILDGRQPASLTRQRLARWRDLPFDWQKQREVLGFAAERRLAA